MPRSKREEAFFAAIDTIKHAIRDGLVMQGWDAQTPVDQIMINRTGHGATYVTRTNDDSACGYDMNANVDLHVIDPAVLFERQQAAARAKYEAAVKRASVSNKELEEAVSQLKYWNDKVGIT